MIHLMLCTGVEIAQKLCGYIPPSQASVMNRIAERYRSAEVLMLCPTEYCDSRSIPSVRESPYVTYPLSRHRPSFFTVASCCCPQGTSEHWGQTLILQFVSCGLASVLFRAKSPETGWLQPLVDFLSIWWDNDLSPFVSYPTTSPWVFSLENVAAVLKRKPVIWDNIHANDYTKTGCFLGPFSGRSSDLLSGWFLRAVFPFIRAVLPGLLPRPPVQRREVC